MELIMFRFAAMINSNLWKTFSGKEEDSLCIYITCGDVKSLRKWILVSPWVFAVQEMQQNSVKILGYVFTAQYTT